jgi:hypothetical protein
MKVLNLRIAGVFCYDLMDETDQRVASLFTKKSHHRNISVMYIVQNLFYHRTISLNAQLHGSIPKPDK